MMIFLRIYLFSIFLMSFVLTEPLKPGEPGGPWTEEEIDIVRDKVIRLFECQNEAAYAYDWAQSDGSKNVKHASCWNVKGLPYKLDEVDLDEYSGKYFPSNIGPTASPSEYNNPKFPQTYKWKARGPTPSRLIQLAFHDCLRYEDDSGGCDGCLNWSGMGYVSPRVKDQFQEKTPDEWKDKNNQKIKTKKATHTNNNKHQLSAGSLELIYQVADWPPGAKSLSVSLLESGKSRADLWQFAGNIALERVINITNQNCFLGTLGTIGNLERHLSAIEGRGNCEIKLEKPIPFRTGRIDCIPDPKKKWTPYPYEATKTEKHSNTYGTGTQVIKDLKKDFGLTASETIALMATHGLADKNINNEEVAKYKWIGGNKKGSFSNMYYKILNGKTYWKGETGMFKGGIEKFKYREYFVGDKNGNPVGGSSFNIHCHGYWYDPDRIYGGPCHFRPLTPGYSLKNSDLKMRQQCFIPKADGKGYDLNKTIAGCETAELFEKDGFLFQKGGPPMDEEKERRNGIRSGLSFLTPFELGFVLDFDVIDNYPSGCGNLDGDWRKDKMAPWYIPKGKSKKKKNRDFSRNRFYIGSPSFDGSAPPCEANMYAPEGEASADIVAKFADDHTLWQKTFFEAWEKMQLNGYDLDVLKESPQNGQLLAPLMNSQETCEKVIQGRILQTSLHWGKSFKIKFDITVEEGDERKGQFMNVFHFTQAADSCDKVVVDFLPPKAQAQYCKPSVKSPKNPADYLSIPAFWIHDSGYFLICNSMIDNEEQPCHKEPFNYGQRYLFELSQSVNGIFQIKMNGNIIRDIQIMKPQEYKNVKAYLSNPWNDKFYGCVENFQLTEGV